jgi:hypothetical protein
VLETVKQLVSVLWHPGCEACRPGTDPGSGLCAPDGTAVCRDVTPARLVQIGRTFDREHTTVMHALTKVDAACRQEPLVAEERASLRQAVVEVLASRSVTARAAAAGAAVRHL